MGVPLARGPCKEGADREEERSEGDPEGLGLHAPGSGRHAQGEPPDDLRHGQARQDRGRQDRRKGQGRSAPSASRGTSSSASSPPSPRSWASSSSRPSRRRGARNLSFSASTAPSRQSLNSCRSCTPGTRTRTKSEFLPSRCKNRVLSPVLAPPRCRRGRPRRLARRVSGRLSLSCGMGLDGFPSLPRVQGAMTCRTCPTRERCFRCGRPANSPSSGWAGQSRRRVGTSGSTTRAQAGDRPARQLPVHDQATPGGVPGRPRPHGLDKPNQQPE